MREKVLPGAVSVGYVHTNIVMEGFTRSLAQLCLWKPNQIMGIISTASARQEISRNVSIEHFLKTPTEWLMWIDTDVTLKYDAIERLLATAEKHEADMVQALGFMYKRHDGIIIPNGYYWNEEINHFTEIDDYDSGEVYEIDGAGSGCILINRKVFEAWDTKFWHETWVNHPKTGGEMGHDLAFAYQATQVDGFKLVWDTGVVTGHIKHFELGEKDFRTYQGMQE